MNKNSLVADSWSRFEKMVLPANCSDVQRLDMRKAFFAGASIVFTIIIDNLPDDENDTSLFDGIQGEISAFGQTLDSDVLGKLKPLGTG